jgi:hypothetical protein
VLGELAAALRKHGQGAGRLVTLQEQRQPQCGAWQGFITSAESCAVQWLAYQDAEVDGGGHDIVSFLWSVLAGTRASLYVISLCWRLGMTR